MSKQPSAPGMVSSRFARPIGFVRDLPIWTKLGLIMIVPTIATIVVGTAGLLDQVDQASGADRARSLTVLSGDAGALVHELQDERALAIQLLNAPAQPRSSRSRPATPSSRPTTRRLNAKYRLSRVHDRRRARTTCATLLDSIEAQLGELPVMREPGRRPEQDAAVRGRATATRCSSPTCSQIRDLSAQLTGDTTLTDRMRAAAAVATAKEFLSQERVVVLQALADGELSPAARRDYIATVTGQELALDNFTGGRHPGPARAARPHGHRSRAARGRRVRGPAGQPARSAQSPPTVRQHRQLGQGHGRPRPT